MSEGQLIRVAIVDDDPLLRAGLTLMLGGVADLQLVGEAGDGRQALSIIDQKLPDVVLMDIRMPTMDGLTAIETLRDRPRRPEVIVLTTFDADAHVLRALRAGACGFLLKDTPPAEIVTAIRDVAEGKPVLSPPVIRRLIDKVADPAVTDQRDRARRRLDRLAEQERRIARAVGQGLTNAEIAATVHLSVSTVKTHVSAILSTLELTNRVQVALLVHDADLPGLGGGPS